MERINLTDALSLSRIVYGMWRLGDDADTSPSHVQAKIEACLEQGITTMDQADIYGGYMAEEILDTGRTHITASVEDSLRLMGIERIDLLLLHRPDPLMDHVETGAVLDELVASGKVRSVGVSNFRPWDWNLLQSAMKTKLVTNQIEISVLAHHPFTNGDIAFLQQQGVPPMAWSPLAGGALFSPDNAGLHETLSAIAARQNSDVTSLVVAWLMAHPARIMPVMGTNSLQRISHFGAAAELTIDRQTWYEIYTAALGHEVP